ncbi:E3 ubiquitin-protein ligase TRIM71-like [Mizuhopecten yessoensis]|uniref:E3 ubiquitin-protein ligase TRIM56 n=1 Tax=Mizuhopecten yessoensis TaxID=6573 RepID=A0A210R1C7_MIZYE|nr:E3 ubiquitin-protein ligase TRIM71-like [Mizuhopecten yessoensis]OWF54863.1 E3 ubiquitin-protein ligase TRIM56 [Mizuhopecten yessoensis]
MVVQKVSCLGQHVREEQHVLNMYSSVLDESEEYIKCGLCWEVPTQTVTLSCSHTFCKWCLKKRSKSGQEVNGRIACPVCGVNDTMTHGQTEEVSSNNGNDRKCDLCEESRPAEARCVECRELMCNFCHQSHRRSKASKHHSITMLGDIHTETGEISGSRCSIHDEELAYFCRPCDTAVCKKCRTSDHKGHRSRPVKVIVGDKRRQLEEKVDTVRHGYVRMLEKKLAEIPKQIKAIKENAESVVVDIIQRSKCIKDQIDAIKLEMIKDVRSKESLGLTRLEQFMRELEKELLTVGESIRRTENVLKQGTDVEVVSICKVSQETFDSLETRRPLPELQKVDVAFESGELVRDMLMNGFGHCSTRNSGFTWSRSVSMCQGDPQDVNIKLVSEFHCPLVVDEDDNDDDFVNESVHTMAAVAGGQISVCCGCESDRVVFTDGTGRVISSLRVGVMIDDLVSRNDHSIVMSCFRDRSIRAIEENGNVRELVSTQYYPRGLTVASDGSLLVCLMDQYSTSVTKTSRRMVARLDSRGQQVQVYEYTDENKRLFTRPYRVQENINGDICVTDKTSMGSGRVVVLDRLGNLRFVYDGRSVSAGERPFSPCGIVCDSYGRLLITDTNNHCIHVVDKNGQFVSFLLRKEDGITCPTSLALDGEGQLWVGNENGQMKVYQYL